MALNGKWPKGVSGNPDGRPRKTPPHDIRQKWNMPIPKDYLGRTYGQALVDKQFARALKGDIKAAEFLASYGFGKPTQAVTLDANVNLTREQQVAKIEHLLEVLPVLPETNELTNERVN